MKVQSTLYNLRAFSRSVISVSSCSIILLLSGCIIKTPPESHFEVMKHALVYPVTAKTNQVDDYHGTLVNDPYRWLEDDNPPETKDWVQAENKVTFDYLSSISERGNI